MRALLRRADLADKFLPELKFGQDNHACQFIWRGGPIHRVNPALEALALKGTLDYPRCRKETTGISVLLVSTEHAYADAIGIVRRAL